VGLRGVLAGAVIVASIVVGTCIEQGRRDQPPCGLVLWSVTNGNVTGAVRDHGYLIRTLEHSHAMTSPRITVYRLGETVLGVCANPS
jgi:hypothetical protein